MCFSLFNRKEASKEASFLFVYSKVIHILCVQLQVLESQYRRTFQAINLVRDVQNRNYCIFFNTIIMKLKQWFPNLETELVS